MKKLTGKEEQIMQVIWREGPLFVKEIRAGLPAPRPHYNTVATVVRILEEKGFVGHETFGNTHRFFAKVTREAYRAQYLGKVLEDYFDNSYKKLVSFFARSEKISPDELREIIKLIEQEKDGSDE